MARTGRAVRPGSVALLVVAAAAAVASCRTLPVAKAAYSSAAATSPPLAGFITTTTTTATSLPVTAQTAASPTITTTTIAMRSSANERCTTINTGGRTCMRTLHSSSSIRASVRFFEENLVRNGNKSAIGSSIRSSTGSSIGSSSRSLARLSTRSPTRSSIGSLMKHSIPDSERVGVSAIGAWRVSVSSEEGTRFPRSVQQATIGEEADSGVSSISSSSRSSRSSRSSNSGGVEGAGVDGSATTSGLATEGAAFDPVLACPYTLSDLADGSRSQDGRLSMSYKASKNLPATTYPIVDESYIDFVKTVKPVSSLSYGDSVKEGKFQKPLVTWLYERGWRQRFRMAGFPGNDEEFRQVEEFFSSTGSEGGVVADLSCGTGHMARRLVASNKYSRVIAGDLSPAMLSEAAVRFRKAGLGTAELIRCDVSELPMKTESLDGVHAGAALHCWSKLEDSLSEVFRVLKPGTGFFATTFLTSILFGFTPKQEGFKYFEQDELKRLMLDAGFAKVEVLKNGLACAIVRATKGVH